MIRAHDIGIQLCATQAEIGYKVIVGGGLGRTPMIGKVLSDFVSKADLLPYLRGDCSVYNLLGRRDNKYKARIKITVHENGIDKIQELVEDVSNTFSPSLAALTSRSLQKSKHSFAPPRSGTIHRRPMTPPFGQPCLPLLGRHQLVRAPRRRLCNRVDLDQETWRDTGRRASATNARHGDLADEYGHDELRISHEQNVILPHVHKSDLLAIYTALRDVDLATANIGLISDIIACPGMDYCALATARSIPVAQEIATRFDELKLEHEVGPLKIKISGCINACGHHHVGHIGILGLDRAGVENYQITLGGDGTETTTIGTRAGPGFGADEIVPAIERLVLGYLSLRMSKEETFLQAYRRLGEAPFKDILYPEKAAQNAA